MNQDKIKMREKLSFAMVNFGNIPVMTLINRIFTNFLYQYMRLRSCCMCDTVPDRTLLDAINDPLVGFIIECSDQKDGTFPTNIDSGNNSV